MVISLVVAVFGSVVVLAAVVAVAVAVAAAMEEDKEEDSCDACECGFMVWPTGEKKSEKVLSLVSGWISHQPPAISIIEDKIKFNSYSSDTDTTFVAWNSGASKTDRVNAPNKHSCEVARVFTTDDDGGPLVRFIFISLLNNIPDRLLHHDHHDYHHHQLLFKYPFYLKHYTQTHTHTQCCRKFNGETLPASAWRPISPPASCGRP